MLLILIVWFVSFSFNFVSKCDIIILDCLALRDIRLLIQSLAIKECLRYNDSYLLASCSLIKKWQLFFYDDFIIKKSNGYINH